MFKLYDFNRVRIMWYTSKTDVLVFLVALLATLFAGLQVGILSAIALSLISMLNSMSKMPMELLLRRKGTTVYGVVPPEKEHSRKVCSEDSSNSSNFTSDILNDSPKSLQMIRQEGQLRHSCNAKHFVEVRVLR